LKGLSDQTMSKDKILAELRKAYVLEQRTRDPELNQIIHPQTVNIAVKAELTHCKLELSRLLGVLETCPADNRRDFLKELTKLLIQASRIQVTTQDQELADLLAKAEAHLG